jgi:predicted DNA-binding ribbon-helix-helix protein
LGDPRASRQHGFSFRVLIPNGVASSRINPRVDRLCTPLLENISCVTAMPVRKGRCEMKSPVIKRSIIVAGYKTSVSLEDAFWKGLREIARSRGMILSEIVAMIDSERQHGNLSSAIRLFVLGYYREQANIHSHGNPAASSTVGLPLAHPPA